MMCRASIFLEASFAGHHTLVQNPKARWERVLVLPEQQGRCPSLFCASCVLDHRPSGVPGSRVSWIGACAICEDKGHLTLLKSRHGRAGGILGTGRVVKTKDRMSSSSGKVAKGA